MRLSSVLIASSFVASAGAALLLLVGGCTSLVGINDYTVGSGASNVDAGDSGDAGGPGVKECTTNAECITKLGDLTICRKQDFKCAKLVSPDCPRVDGDWKNDNAVILGSILPIVGPDKGGGIPQYNGILVGLDDFAKGSNGLPPVAGSPARRPIVMVGCSEESDDVNDSDAPTRSAKHLVDDLKVPAIIGASYSGDTQTVAQVTIPAGVLLMSPSATSVAITSLQDNGLVWRTSPSDVIQAKALVKLMPEIEQLTSKRKGLGVNDSLRVLILNKGDSYGKGLAAALQTDLSFNGKPALDASNAANFKVIDYGDPSSATPPNYDQVRQQAFANLATAPYDIVFLLGTDEIVPEFLRTFEVQAWPGGKKPTYLFPDGGLIPALWEEVAANNDLRKRIFGTTPGTNNPVFQLFKSHYASFIKDGTTGDSGGVASSYDAIYLLGYAIAALGNDPITGANINAGLKRLVPPGAISRPSTTSINAAFAVLATGKNIDYDGASGPLDFDVVTGEAESDIQVWCLPTVDKTVTGTAASAANSNVFFDAKAGLIPTTSTIYPMTPDVQAACNLPATFPL